MLDTIDKVKKETGKSRISIFLDMQKCARRYGAGYSDYYLLEFYNKTEQQRNMYYRGWGTMKVSIPGQMAV